MAFGFSQVAYVSNKTKCLLKIAEAKGSFDAVSIIDQIPIRGLRLKPLRFLMRERRDAATTRGAFLLGERFGHVRGLREMTVKWFNQAERKRPFLSAAV